MEGSKRSPIVEVGVTAPDQDEVDETPVTDYDIQNHTVAPDEPRYLMAAFLGAGTKARIRSVGLTRDNAMDTLASIFDAAWYRNSGKPGSGGTILINGHNGGPTKIGIFKYLNLVKPGEIITVERGDGAIFQYEVYESKILLLPDANAHMSAMMHSPVPGKESLSLISCTGEWSQQRRTYLSRAMVRAVLIEDGKEDA